MKRYMKKSVKYMMKRRKSLKRITTTAAVGATSMLAQGQFRPARQHFVIPVETVARTITASFANRGIQVSSEQVKLPLDVLATEENPLLEVGTVGKLGQLSSSLPGQESASIRLHCKIASTCTPFYAIVSWQGEQQSLFAPAKASSINAPQLVANRLVTAQLAESQLAAISPTTDRTATPAEIAAAVQHSHPALQQEPTQQDHPGTLVKTGAPMTLMIEGEGAHIRLAVVSVSSGSLGQKIRVATPDHKHFYMAEVQSANIVKGSF